MLTALQLVKDQLKEAHSTFENTVIDINAAHLHKLPGGKALPLGSLVAHLVFSEDVIVNGMILGNAPFYTALWKGKTGASVPMPAMDEKWSVAHEEWSRTVQVKLPELLKYMKAVFSATEYYVSTLKQKELEREINLGSWGKKPLVSLLTGFVIAHTNNLTGEISAIKGVNGAKGYPF